MTFFTSVLSGFILASLASQAGYGLGASIGFCVLSGILMALHAEAYHQERRKRERERNKAG